GACPEVNLAVEQLAKTGILGGVSVLANGKCWEQGGAFLRDKPHLGPGVHLNAVEGRPISAAPQVEILTGTDFDLRCRRYRPPLDSIEVDPRAQVWFITQKSASLLPTFAIREDRHPSQDTGLS